MTTQFYHRNPKVNLCMKADNAIRGILQVDSAWCSDPNVRTVTTEWDDFLLAVNLVVDTQDIREWSREELDEVYNTLEGHNYHMFRKALIYILERRKNDNSRT